MEFRQHDHACVLSEDQLVCIDTHTPHIWMEVPVNVSTCDVSSCSSRWNIFHIQYTCMVVPSCGFVDVLLSCLVVWNFYHIVHMWRVYCHSEFWDDLQDHYDYGTSSHIRHTYISSVYHTTHLLQHILLLVSLCKTCCVWVNHLRDRSRDHTIRTWRQRLKWNSVSFSWHPLLVLCGTTPHLADGLHLLCKLKTVQCNWMLS